MTNAGCWTLQSAVVQETKTTSSGMCLVIHITPQLKSSEPTWGVIHVWARLLVSHVCFIKKMVIKSRAECCHLVQEGSIAFAFPTRLTFNVHSEKIALRKKCPPTVHWFWIKSNGQRNFPALIKINTQPYPHFLSLCGSGNSLYNRTHGQTWSFPCNWKWYISLPLFTAGC